MEVVWNVFALLIVILFANALLLLLNSIANALFGVGGNNLLNQIVQWLLRVFSYLKYVLILLSLLLLWWIIHYYRKLYELRKIEAASLYTMPAETKDELNPVWGRILKNVQSDNESDWRLAILEADIILGDILDKLFLPGETIGDKLKAVEESDFRTIGNAWEAHKIRNKIAHEGESFAINQHETKRVIDLYKSVFDEFQVI